MIGDNCIIKASTLDLESTMSDRSKRRWPWMVLGVVAALTAYLFLWPIDFDPVAWEAPPAPALEGPYALNDALAGVELLALGVAPGAEDVDVDAAGNIYAGLADGRVVVFDAAGANLRELANTQGRPLGLEFDKAGNLIIADARRGLLSLAPDGTLTVLSESAGGVPFGFADDVDVAEDGTIYFSDASSRYGVDDYKLDLLEHRPHGRLLAYDPGTKETRVVLDSLYFANGVAVSEDQSYVLVTETGAYRVRRVWIAGPRAGQNEVLIDNLPAFPDGISRGSGGVFWLAFAAPRMPLIEALSPYPFLRKAIVRLPRALWPKPDKHAWLLGIDGTGQVVANLQHLDAKAFSPLTSVEQHGDSLYLGSLEYNGIARIAVPR